MCYVYWSAFNYCKLFQTRILGVAGITANCFTGCHRLARFARSPVVARFARSQRCGYLPPYGWCGVFTLQPNFFKRMFLGVCPNQSCKRCGAASPGRREFNHWFGTPSASSGGFHTSLVRLRSTSATLRLLPHGNITPSNIDKAPFR